MKITYEKEQSSHALEIYLSAQELKILYQDDGDCVKIEKNLFGDKLPCHVYIGHLYSDNYN